MGLLKMMHRRNNISPLWRVLFSHVRAESPVRGDDRQGKRLQRVRVLTVIKPRKLSFNSILIIKIFDDIYNL